MVIASGIGLVLLGVLIIVFGGAPPAGDERRPLQRPWMDIFFRWGMGAGCIWFGGGLLAGLIHF